MAFKCCECGHIFEEGEQSVWKERHGFAYGGYETFDGCPRCKGDYEETVKCKVCGGEHLDEELFGGVCEECINEYRKDFDSCYEISIGEKEEIKINSLLASLFDAGDIEAILVEHIKKNMPDIDCSDYIDNDIERFGEFLAKEV
jgi:reverse gyrase